MGNYSKLIGSVVGGIVGLAVSKFGLPADWASPEMTASITTILAAIATYFFPANEPG